MRKSGLGRGVSALMGDDFTDIQLDSAVDKDYIHLLDISLIDVNKAQPRKTFNNETIAALAESIKANGMLQPITVHSVGDRYEIVAGERRYRACRLLKMDKIPAIIKELSPRQVSELALVENLQREDLNPIEEAAGYARLAEEFEMTQEEISKSVGKSRSAITNCMRLLNLSAPVRKLVEQLEISAGHARTLLAIEDKDLQEKTAYLVIEKDMSVRQLENYVNLLKKPERLPKVREAFSVVKDDIEKLLEGALGTKVKIISGKKKGKIEIEFYDKESLDRIVSRLKRG